LEFTPLRATATDNVTLLSLPDGGNLITIRNLRDLPGLMVSGNPIPLM
jgi:hypothetical protein